MKEFNLDKDLILAKDYSEEEVIDIKPGSEVSFSNL